MTDPLIDTGADYSSIAISSTGTLYVGDMYTNLYAIDSNNGSIIWSYPTDAGTGYSSPAIAQDGTIYIVSDSATLYAITDNGNSATLKWTYSIPGHYHTSAGSPIVASDGTIIMLSRNTVGVLTAINPDSTLRWEYSLIGNIGYGSPSIGSNNIIYVGDDVGYLYGIDINGNEVLKVQLFYNDVSSPPAFSQDNNTIYIGAGYNYSTNDYTGSGLYALNINTGAVIWYFPTPTQDRCTPAISANGTIYVGDDYNPPNFYAINPDGTLKWSHELVDIVRSSPAIAADGTVYVGDRDNNFYAFQSIASPSACPITPKYSGDTVTLKATPKDGIGPYYVEFQKNGVLIDPSRLGGTNPGTSQLYDVLENVSITREYTLDDLDVSTSGGTIDFSVYMSDSCPTIAQTCTDTCTITIGCIAPVCNFTVI